MRPITNILLVLAVICYVFLPFYDISMLGTVSGMGFTAGTISQSLTVKHVVLALMPFIACFGAIACNCLKKRWWVLGAIALIIVGLWFFKHTGNLHEIMLQHDPEIAPDNDLGEGFTITGLGIGYVPEGRRVFGKLTVEENLRMGAYELKDNNHIRENMEKVYEIFPRLGERKDQLASTMSGGEQQMLAISRALMLDPKMLLIDEVSMGLMPIMVNTCFDVIQKLNKQGITILVVEQNANKALKVADRGYVLETGNIIISDTAENMRKDDTVQKAYLGG